MPGAKPFLAILALCTGILRAHGGICQHVPASSLPFCDLSLPRATRVQDLVGRLSLTEKALQLGTGTPPVPRVGLTSYNYWNEALHGVARSPGVRFRGKLGFATAFPQVLTLASSFDRELWADVAGTIGKEARAFRNAGLAGGTVFTPNINIYRDPRWGRGQVRARVRASRLPRPHLPAPAHRPPVPRRPRGRIHTCRRSTPRSPSQACSPGRRTATSRWPQPASTPSPTRWTGSGGCSGPASMHAWLPTTGRTPMRQRSRCAARWPPRPRRPSRGCSE